MPHPDASVYPGEVFAGRWEVGAFIGDGNFSLVYEGRVRITGAGCAIKVLSMTRRSSDALEEFRAESELLRLLHRCSNVITILDSGSHPMTAAVGGATFPIDVEYIVLERADADLAELLMRRHSLTWEDRIGLFRDVAKGLHQMHLQRIVNRDLKGDNVLVVAGRRQATAKISDLGRSKDTRQGPRFRPEDYTSGRGDLRFAPPEMLWGLGNTNAETMRLADLYLLGSVFFEVATAQGLTALALGNPHLVMMGTSGMSRTDREADFNAHKSDLQARYELAYSLFEQEIPSAIRDVGSRILRQLTATDPVLREPNSLRQHGLPTRWDLQWLLRKVDVMPLILRIDERRARKRR